MWEPPETSNGVLKGYQIVVRGISFKVFFHTQLQWKFVSLTSYCIIYCIIYYMYIILILYVIPNKNAGLAV